MLQLCDFEYSSPPKVLPTKGLPSYFQISRCSEIVQYYLIAPLKSGHPSYKVTFSLKNCMHY